VQGGGGESQQESKRGLQLPLAKVEADVGGGAESVGGYGNKAEQ